MDDLILIVPHAVVFFIGLPWTILLLAELVTERGPGLPIEGAWPNVSWTRSLGGYAFIVFCIVLHLAVTMALAVYVGNRLLSALGMAPEVGPDGKLQDTASGTAVRSLLMCLQWAVVCGLLIGYIARRRGRVRSLGLSVENWGRQALSGLKGLLGTLPAVLVLMIVVHLLYVHFAEEPPALHPVLAAMEEAKPAWAEAVLLATSVLVIPLFEELFWRGIVQTSLMRSGSAGLAIVGSAVLFASSHQWDDGAWTNIPALAALGLGLGYVFYRTGNLAAPIAMHAAFNLYNVLLQEYGPLLRDLVTR